MNTIHTTVSVIKNYVMMWSIEEKLKLENLKLIIWGEHTLVCILLYTTITLVFLCKILLVKAQPNLL